LRPPQPVAMNQLLQTHPRIVVDHGRHPPAVTIAMVLPSRNGSPTHPSRGNFGFGRLKRWTFSSLSAQLVKIGRVPLSAQLVDGFVCGHGIAFGARTENGRLTPPARHVTNQIIFLQVETGTESNPNLTRPD